MLAPRARSPDMGSVGRHSARFMSLVHDPGPARPACGALKDSSCETTRTEDHASEKSANSAGNKCDQLREKPGADFLAIMKRKCVIGPLGTLEAPVGALLPGN